MKKILPLLLIFTSFYVYASDIEGDTALLRGVDKITGHTATSKLAVGKPTAFNNMRLTVERCLTKPADETPENAAFILIEEKKNNTYQVVFNGWMFSSNPALSAMEHPIFDIWLLSCEAKEENTVSDSEITTAKNSPKEQINPEVATSVIQNSISENKMTTKEIQQEEKRTNQ